MVPLLKIPIATGFHQHLTRKSKPLLTVGSPISSQLHLQISKLTTSFSQNPNLKRFILCSNFLFIFYFFYMLDLPPIKKSGFNISFSCKLILTLLKTLPHLPKKSIEHFPKTKPFPNFSLSFF